MQHLSARRADGRDERDAGTGLAPGGADRRRRKSANSYRRITGSPWAERGEWPRTYSRVVASARGRQEHDRPVRHPDDRPARGHRLHFTGGRGTGHAQDHAGW